MNGRAAWTAVSRAPTPSATSSSSSADGQLQRVLLAVGAGVEVQEVDPPEALGQPATAPAASVSVTSTTAGTTVAPEPSRSAASSSSCLGRSRAAPTSYPSSANRRATDPLTPGPAPTATIAGLLMETFYRSLRACAAARPSGRRGSRSGPARPPGPRRRPGRAVRRTESPALISSGSSPSGASSGDLAVLRVVVHALHTSTAAPETGSPARVVAGPVALATVEAMTRFGYTLMTEQSGPRELVRLRRRGRGGRLRLRGDERPLLPVADRRRATRRTPGRCWAPWPRRPSGSS